MNYDVQGNIVKVNELNQKLICKNSLKNFVNDSGGI